eukprot:5434835-Amphidinium_carterae.1
MQFVLFKGTCPPGNLGGPAPRQSWELVASPQHLGALGGQWAVGAAGRHLTSAKTCSANSKEWSAQTIALNMVAEPRWTDQDVRGGIVTERSVVDRPRIQNEQNVDSGPTETSVE